MSLEISDVGKTKFTKPVKIFASRKKNNALPLTDSIRHGFELSNGLSSKLNSW